MFVHPWRRSGRAAALRLGPGGDRGLRLRPRTGIPRLASHKPRSPSSVARFSSAARAPSQFKAPLGPSAAAGGHCHEVGTTHGSASGGNERNGSPLPDPTNESPQSPSGPVRATIAGYHCDQPMGAPRLEGNKPLSSSSMAGFSRVDRAPHTQFQGSSICSLPWARQAFADRAIALPIFGLASTSATTNWDSRSRLGRVSRRTSFDR